MSEPRTGVYPGTFDPITNGHMDIITRATSVVDRLIVAVADSDGKGPMFVLDERVQMIEEELAALPPETGGRVQVLSFDTLLMRFVAELGASVIIRGLRAVSDFEYEFQMAGMNARLNPDVETVFLMASERHQFISSRFVKEIARLGGDISSFVSSRVAAHVDARLAAGG
ncbi:MAG: pantetheine-phosphate adenylyltransferase [Alphaproteobacteria bacterium]|nr:pantetheine-phosphate adenylyltransferase [Alphaproteobacteria bacterium]